MMQAVALETQRVNPILRDTLDENQKTFRFFGHQTIIKWREALALRYFNNLDRQSDFSVTWEDRDYSDNVIQIPFNCTEPSSYNLAKTFVQIYHGDDKKCITITLYFLKKCTRKKGAGTCLIQGNQCQAWARNEFNVLCTIVNTLLDSTMSADELPLPPSDNGIPADVSDNSAPRFITYGSTSDNLTTSEDGEDAVPAAVASTVTVISPAESQPVTVTPETPPPADSDHHHQVEAPPPADSDQHHQAASLPLTDSDQHRQVETSPPTDSDQHRQAETPRPDSDNHTPLSIESTTPAPIEGTPPSPTNSTTPPPMECDLSLNPAIQPEDTSGPTVSALCPTVSVTVPPSPPSLATEPAADPTTDEQTADNDAPDANTTTAPKLACTEGMENYVCVQCQQPFAASVCKACIIDFDADLKSHMDHKMKVLAQTMQDKFDSLAEECSRLRILVKEQKKLIDSLSDRQKHILKQNKKPECAPVQQKFDKECQCHSETASLQAKPKSANATGSSAEDRKVATTKVNSNSNSTTTTGSSPQCVADSEVPLAVSSPHPVADTSSVTTVTTLDDQKQAPKYKIRLPPKGKIVNFIVGDSNLQYIDRYRLDKTGSTHVRTMPGTKVTDVTASLRDSPVREDVQRVALLVGGNDLHKHYTIGTLKRDFGNLLLQTKKTFPTAEIGVSALLPRKSVSLGFVNSLNNELHELCMEKGACFLFEGNFVDQNQRIVKSYFSSDRVHLSATGLSLWLRQVIQFLALHANRPSRFNQKRTQPGPHENRATRVQFDSRSQTVVEESPKRFPTSNDDRAPGPVLPDTSHSVHMAKPEPVRTNLNSHQPVYNQRQPILQSNTANEKNSEGFVFQSPRESAPHQAMPPMPYFTRGSPTPSLPMFSPMWPCPPFPPMPFNPWLMHRYFPPASAYQS